jgi:uncharacterized protein Yka (UPF0111/DUF47 family)
MIFSKANKSIILIERFLNLVDESVLTFKEGVKNYLYNSNESFKNNLQHLANLELESDSIRKEIEHTLYTQSLMPQLRGDIMKLLEEMDNIIDLSKKEPFSV